MPDIVKQLLLQLVLIALNAFFAATEIALISLNEKKVRAAAEDGDKKAKKMLGIITEPTKFLSTIQIGITLAGFLASAFAADNFAGKLSAFIIRTFPSTLGYEGVINTVSVVFITLVLSYFTLILGELVPKRVAMKHKDKLARGVCGLISFLTTILKPIIWFLSASTNAVLRLFGISPNEQDEAVSEEDIVIMLDAGADEGTLKQDDIEYIKNVFKLERLSAVDIMTPRSAVVAVPADISEEELLAVIENEAYSRIPVYSGSSMDKIIGILPASEYLLKRNRPDFVLEDILLDPAFVPETIHLDALFKTMQSEHTHMSVVVNEFGLTSGVITMEDIIEELVGEIWDEQDEATEPILPVGEDTFRVMSGVSIDDFFEYFSLKKDESILSATVNGWLLEYFGSIPEVGSSFEHQGLSITVTQADEQMTHELQVIILPEEPESTDEDEEDKKEDEKEEKDE